jgi:hypothetical protein
VLQLLDSTNLDEIKADFGDQYPHPSLLAAIQLSIDDLPDERSRRLYRMLAVFNDRGTFPRSAVEALWAAAGPSTPQVSELLTLLEGRSLISKEGPDWFGVHDLQMEVVAKQLGPGQLLSAHSQLVEGYRARCQGGWPTGPNDGYLLENLAYHLARANRHHELNGLLTDLSWMRVRLVGTDLAGLLTDFTHSPDATLARTIRAALVLSAAALSTNPDQLPGQLVGRLLDNPEPSVRAAMEAFSAWQA